MLVQPTQEQMATIRAHNQTNDSYAFAFFGALATLAGTPVVARGLSTVMKVAAIMVLAVTGAAIGLASVQIGFYCQDWLPMWDPLVRSAVLRAAMFAPFGIIGGLLTAMFQRCWGKTGSLLVGGLVGSILVATIYCLVAGFLFHGENSDAVLPVGMFSRGLLFGGTPFLVWAFITKQCSFGCAPEMEPATRQMETA